MLTILKVVLILKTISFVPPCTRLTDAESASRESKPWLTQTLSLGYCLLPSRYTDMVTASIVFLAWMVG